jgi:spermidine synthase
VPLYGGLWMMAMCSATLDPRHMTTMEVDRRLGRRGIRDLAYYNGDTHRASLALPNFVRALVSAG